jgi:guanylate kinase
MINPLSPNPSALFVRRDPEIAQLPGRFVVLSGPSGVGKGTVQDAVEKSPEISERLSRVKSIKTRPARNLQEQKENHFVTVDDFCKAIDDNRLFEWGTFAGHFYGRLLSDVRDVLRRGMNVLLEFPPADSLRFKEVYPEKTATVFISPPEPTMENIERRLRSRQTESEGDIQRRLEEARQGLAFRDQFDTVVYNPDGGLGQAIAETRAFILENTAPPEALQKELPEVS